MSQPPPTPGPPVGVSVRVCVPTFRRPQGLARLLESLNGLQFRDAAPDVRILVIDNNPDGSAMAQVEAHRRDSRWPVDYWHETGRGVAAVRNAALARTAGCDMIAFIDDDELAEPSWLDELLAVQRRTGADVVTGTVLPLFMGPVPRWIEEGGFFDRPRHEDGARISDARTSNVLIRRAVFEETGLDFDPRLSLIGGEDTILFQQLVLRGRTIVWADHAVVHDCVPPSRTTLRWLLKRWFRTGNVEARIFRLRHPSFYGAGANVLRGFARVGGGGLLLLKALVTSGGRRHCLVSPLYTISRGCGILASVLRLDYKEYENVQAE